MPTEVDTDDWGEVLNGARTYEQLALDLRNHRAVVIGWTDQHCTHYDILLTLCPKQYDHLQGGLRGRSDLFVSIMRKGYFGFDIASQRELHPSYIEEKLGSGASGPTAQAIADLINGVLASLAAPRQS